MKPGIEAVSTEERLKKLRARNPQDLQLKYGELEIPCRLMTATEEATIIASAKARVKVPNEADRPHFEAIEIQKSILEKACTIGSNFYAARPFLDQLTGPELETLFDQYVSILRTANPQFESLTPDEIDDMIRAVKKKEKSSREFYTWQLAEIARYFLDRVLPMVKEPGSS